MRLGICTSMLKARLRDLSRLCVFIDLLSVYSAYMRTIYIVMTRAQQKSVRGGGGGYFRTPENKSLGLPAFLRCVNTAHRWTRGRVSETGV